MKYTHEMILRSDSGYAMPFEDGGRNVKVSLMYGEQRHPRTGRPFFHHGLDLTVRHYMLTAMATGRVTGVGLEPERGLTITIAYGSYTVKYSHLENILVDYGTEVMAGQNVALSGPDILHIGVTYDGEEINPVEFLTMMHENYKIQGQCGNPTKVLEPIDLGYSVKTRYDDHKDEIEKTMLGVIPSFLNDLRLGLYSLPQRQEMQLRNCFLQGFKKNLFFEQRPSIGNPMGLGRRSEELVTKVMNLLIEITLEYAALCHGSYPDYMSGDEKKKRGKHRTKPKES